MRFRDGSVLRVDELSEVAVRGGTRDVFVNRGAMFGSYRGPGTVSSGYAVAAVKGTDFEFRRLGRTVRVRCFSGTVYVGAGSGDARAGSADSGTASSFTDDALIGQTRDWIGRTVRVMAGPDEGEERRITDFDPETGTVTVDRPFGRAPGAEFDYLLTTNPDLRVIVLAPGMETQVHENEEPTRPRRRFAHAPGGPPDRGRRDEPWFEGLPEGARLHVLAGTAEHQQEQHDHWSLDEAVGRTAGLEERFGDVGVLRGRAGAPSEGLEVVIPTPGTPTSPRNPTDNPQSPGRTAAKGRGAERLAPAPSLLRRGQGERSRTRSLPAAVGGGSAAWPLALLATPVGGYHPAGDRAGLAWETEPYGFGSDKGEAVGSQARLRLFGRRTMGVVGGRFAYFNGDFHSDLSEAYLMHRSSRWGALSVGRQHLYIGPANNSDLGKLVGFETTDAALWSSPTGRRMRCQLGYLWDSAPLQGDGFSGWFGRAQARMGAGMLGANLLTAHRAGGGLGASVDLSFPLLPDRLDVYGEYGQDPFGRDLVTAGLYFPGVFQSAGVDTFLEYQARSGFDERLSLRLRKALGQRWLAFGYLAHELGGGVSSGLGVRYRWQWR
jgi:hypothetical protein